MISLNSAIQRVVRLVHASGCSLSQSFRVFRNQHANTTSCWFILSYLLSTQRAVQHYTSPITHSSPSHGPLARLL